MEKNKKIILFFLLLVAITPFFSQISGFTVSSMLQKGKDLILLFDDINSTQAKYHCDSDLLCESGSLCCNTECKKIACKTDFTCNDSNEQTIDLCVNPNSCYSRCENKIPEKPREKITDANKDIYQITIDKNTSIIFLDLTDKNQTIIPKIISNVSDEKNAKFITPIIYVSEKLAFKNALITLPKTKPNQIKNILRCGTFDENKNTCLTKWENYPTYFEQTDKNISFEVKSFSAYAGGIIPIINAEHLDSDKNFISNIYDQVYLKDNIWSETINPNEYVRVTFEQPLTQRNDITIYARADSNAKIEVYVKDKNDLIATFEGIFSEEWHKALLSDLNETEEYSIFDLKVLDSAVEFDYIVDPNLTNLDVNSYRVEKRSLSGSLPYFTYQLDGNLTLDINFATDTNYGYHYLDINYSTSKTEGTGNTIVDSLRIDSNRCQTNFWGDWNNYPNSDSHLLAYYKFDSQEDDTNASRAFDYSGNNRHGEYVNGADNNARGMWDNNAAFFDGVNDYIRISLPSMDTYVLSMWVFTTAATGYDALIGESGSTAFYFGDGRYLNYYYDGTDHFGGTNMSYGEWHNITIQQEGTNVNYYIDGSSDTGYSDAPSIVFRTIGATGSGAEAFPGRIEEVKIWNQLLGSTAIYRLWLKEVRQFRSCSWDWNILGVHDLNYYINSRVKDSAGNTDFNSSDKNFRIAHCNCRNEFGWEITDGLICVVDTNCNFVGGNIHLKNGKLIVRNNATLGITKTNKIIVEKPTAQLIVEKGSKVVFGETKKPNGTACDYNTSCVSGICAQGYCCSTACDNACYSCGLAGSLGTCTAASSAWMAGTYGCAAGSYPSYYRCNNGVCDPCDGRLSNGGCWYYGDSYESCDSACGAANCVTGIDDVDCSAGYWYTGYYSCYENSIDISPYCDESDGACFFGGLSDCSAEPAEDYSHRICNCDS